MYVNRNLGIEYVGGYEKIYNNLCISFLKSYEDFEGKIRNALGDEKALFDLVHSLKGIALNLGAERLYELIKNNKFEDLEEFLNVFNNTYNEIKQAI